MAEGYSNFEDFVNTEYITAEVKGRIYKVTGPFGHSIWSDETRATAYYLLEEGIPASLLSRLLDMPRDAASKWGRDIEKLSARKNIVKKWYNFLSSKDIQQSKGFSVTLDDFLEDYGTGLVNNIDLATDVLFKLHQHKIDFPYTPQQRDAYLFGANHGNGSISNRLSLHFTGTDDELDVIDALMLFNTDYRNKGTIVYSKAMGRLYHLMRLPKGDRQTQDLTIPEWIDGKVFISEFLGGLFDTAKDADHKSHKIYIRQFSHPEYKKSFTQFIKNIASMFRKLDIDLAKKGENVKTQRTQLVGTIPLLYSIENIRKIKNKLKTRFKNSQDFLEAA